MAEEPDHAFNERFRTTLQRVGQLQYAAELTGFSAEQIAKWRDGKARPPFKPLAILAATAGVTLDWLAFGTEELLFEHASDVNVDTTYLPLLNVVASTGNGNHNDNVEVVDRLPFSRTVLRQHGVNPKNAQFIKAAGDSMLPTIADGAIVLVDTSVHSPREDGIYCLVIGNEVRLKRVQLGVRGLTLISDNTDKYAAETITPDQLDQVRVAGKVFWSGSGI